jgi:tetratricopeptide (TPR) repeat protein
VLESAGILLAIVVFWLARIRHVLLGDGLAVIERPPGTGGIHGFEPLTSLVQEGAFRLVRATAGSRTPEWQLIWTAVALVSIAAGALFVPVAWRLAREIEATGRERVPASDPMDPAAARSRRWTELLVLSILLSQGYMELFFGYVETYAPVVLANGLVLLTGIRYARAEGSLLAAGAAIVLAVAFHFSAAALIPAWLLIALWGMVRAPDRARARRDFALTLVLAAVLAAVLAVVRPGYSMPRSLWDVSLLAATGRQENAAYLLSWEHLRDFVNEQVLTGPLGFVAFLGGTVFAVVRGTWRRLEAGFAIVAGLGCTFACLRAGDSNLGYARNWDLLAPAGVIFIGSGLMLVRPLFDQARIWRQVLVLGAALSVFHTLPWVLVNASESRGVQWFETLPLGLGRTESTIGLWYAFRGRVDLAEHWLMRSLDRNPSNTRAHYFLGEIYLATGRPERACLAFGYALKLRPEKDEYRLELARALALSGRWPEARAALQPILEREPSRAAAWAFDGILLFGSGQLEGARAAIGRALALQPGDSLYARVLSEIQSRASVDRMLRDDGADLVQR